MISRFIDLFCGMGGFRIAGERAGLRCVFSSEIDEAARDTYERNFGERPSGDITKIFHEEIPDHDILCGGFPCQSFSIAGRKKGFEDAVRGTLFFDIIRTARVKRPAVLFLENVRNLERHDGGKTLSTIIQTILDIGYIPFSKIISSSGFGVPTDRRRIYIVCFRSDLGIKNFSFPVPPGKTSVLKDFLLPDSETSKYICDRDDFVFKRENAEADVPLFGITPQEPVRIGEIQGSGDHQGYRVYSSLGHAITLSSNSGGIFAATGAYLVNGKVRKLAPRECARIMGFPDDFVLPENDKTSWHQIGNSVAIPVVEAIFRNIKGAFDGLK